VPGHGDEAAIVFGEQAGRKQHLPVQFAYFERLASNLHAKSEIIHCNGIL